MGSSSRWPLHSFENKETKDFDLNIAQTEPLDMNLEFNVQSRESSSSQVPITQNQYQNVDDASYSRQVYFLYLILVLKPLDICYKNYFDQCLNYDLSLEVHNDQGLIFIAFKIIIFSFSCFLKVCYVCL